MINKMREMAPVIMLIILVAFVGGTIFLDWGMNLTSRGRKMMPVGKIDGKEITLSYFDQRVNQERQRLQENNRDVPPQQYKMVPNQVWEQEVNSILMKKVTKDLHLEATAEEVFSHIKNNPLPGIDTVSAFQTDGKYDTSKYVMFLNDPNNYMQYRWLHEIEIYTADKIVPMKKMETILIAGAIPTPSEITYKYKKKNSKVVFEYLKVNASEFTVDSSSITPEIVAAYYTANKDSFKVTEQADIYFVKFPKISTEFDEKIYRQDLMDMKERIEASDQPLSVAFSNEAAIESDDPGSSKQGGDLGWFKRGTMVKEFDSIAFSLPIGTISEPVKTTFGMHLIYVEAREKKDSVLQVHARHILRKISPTMETLDLLAEHTDSVRIQMLNKGFITAAMEDTSTQLDSTGLFEKGSIIPKIGYLNGVGTFIYKQNDQKISERLENNDAFYLIALKRKEDAGYLSLDDAKNRIKKNLNDSIQLVSAENYLKEIKKTCNSDSMASYKEKDSTVTSGITDTVTGSQYVSDIGFASPVVGRAMVIPIGTISSVITDDKSCFLIKPLWKHVVDSTPSLTTPPMLELATQIQQQTSQRIYYDWYLEYKKGVNIKCNIDKIYVE